MIQFKNEKKVLRNAAKSKRTRAVDKTSIKTIIQILTWIERNDLSEDQLSWAAWEIFERRYYLAPNQRNTAKLLRKIVSRIDTYRAFLY